MFDDDDDWAIEDPPSVSNKIAPAGNQKYGGVTQGGIVQPKVSSQ